MRKLRVSEAEDIVSGKEEGEEINYALVVIKDKLGVEFMDENEEFKKLMNSYFYNMNNNIINFFELISSQLGGKLAARGSSSSHHEGKKTYGETISLKIGPHNRPHDFKNQNPQFLNF